MKRQTPGLSPLRFVQELYYLAWVACGGPLGRGTLSASAGTKPRAGLCYGRSLQGLFFPEQVANDPRRMCGDERIN
ncbi:MAG: hypothetical protein C0467_30925 [Planctomycetaceae bacterium]|nr:hypothetical protein [Planctomycetaceae bacterium]